MRYFYICTTAWLFLACFLITQTIIGQDGSSKASIQENDKPQVQFNGLGRGLLMQTGIDGEILKSDSTAIETITDGEFLLDFEINALPNKNTEVQTILRLRNEFGGFFGAGVSVEVRELWARGIIADVLKYRIGDIDAVMTPYTLYNQDEEISFNEPFVFSQLRDVVHYEQFYTNNNTRRLQGAQLEFGLNFGTIIQEIDFNGLITRIRGTDFFTVPTRLVTGGSIDISSVLLNDSLGSKINLGINLLSTLDDLQSGNANSGIRNNILTLDIDATFIENNTIGLHLLGETGQSTLITAERINNENGEKENIILSDKDDTFLDIGASLELKKQNLKISASFIDIGPDFFSVAAQSKRIDFEKEKTFYNRIGVDRNVRSAGLFDLSRDRNLFTFRVSDKLMSYDPRYANTSPYGLASPNRQGLKFGLHYGEQNHKIFAKVEASLLKEIRGQGTLELKNFALVRAMANFNLHQYLDWKNDLRITLGLQTENTDRKGLEVEQIKLSSTIFEAGLEMEAFKDFHFLLGAKLFSSKGSEYVPIISQFNEIQDFPEKLDIDDKENLFGAGIKYDFKENVFITIQFNHYTSKLGIDNPLDYNLNQAFVLYSMKF